MSRDRLSMRQRRLAWAWRSQDPSQFINCPGCHLTFLSRTRKQDLRWPLPEGISDAALEELLSGPPLSSFPPPLARLCPIHQELKCKGITLQLLWRAIKYFQGVLSIMTPDDLRSAVTWRCDEKTSQLSCGGIQENLFKAGIHGQCRGQALPHASI